MHLAMACMFQLTKQPCFLTAKSCQATACRHLHMPTIPHVLQSHLPEEQLIILSHMYETLNNIEKQQFQKFRTSVD